MLQIALDVETGLPASVGETTVSRAQQLIALVRQHRNLASEAQSALLVQLHCLALQRVERNTHRAVMIVRADDQCSADALRRVERQLQRAHSTQRSADC